MTMCLGCRLCDICGKMRGGKSKVNHDKCSRIRQQTLAPKRKSGKKVYDEKNVDYLCKTGVPQ